jgi:hypothetical protein
MQYPLKISNHGQVFVQLEIRSVFIIQNWRYIMTPYNIIAAFLQVVETQDYIFDQQSRENLNTIKQKLIEVENQPLEVAADAITNWFQEHETVLHAVRFTAREIEVTNKSDNPVNRETTLSNQFPGYQEKIDQQINYTPPEATQNQPVVNQ